MLVHTAVPIGFIAAIGAACFYLKIGDRTGRSEQVISDLSGVTISVVVIMVTMWWLWIVEYGPEYDGETELPSASSDVDLPR
ncbi:hypothetical protein ABMA46_00120 [Mesorhizobium sp. CN5-321]|jgi:hypothetical protein|uniref:hypothetical protein n=1 Tax=Mesorhizobium hunchu TaxID=3157708 RepID=UPI0032B75552